MRITIYLNTTEKLVQKLQKKMQRSGLVYLRHNNRSWENFPFIQPEVTKLFGGKFSNPRNFKHKTLQKQFLNQ